MKRLAEKDILEAVLNGIVNLKEAKLLLESSRKFTIRSQLITRSTNYKINPPRMRG